MIARYNHDMREEPMKDSPRWFWYAATAIVAPTVAFVIGFVINPLAMGGLLFFFGVMFHAILQSLLG
jgi:hypothetical protein